MIVNKYQGNGGGGGGSYVLPAATANRLGGIKVGDGLSVTPDGTLSSSSSDFNKLMAVSELPASGETGEVVALSSETGETITFNVSDVVFGEGEDILEISGDGLHTLTVNAFHDAENQVNVLKLTNSLNEEYLVEDGSSAMLPASTDEELLWTWRAELNNGVVTIKLHDDDNDAYLPLSTSNISLNVCDAKVNGTFVGVYQYDGSSWNEIGDGSSAYKIELSTSNPDDFTQEDIANLNAFFAAVEADPSIKDTAYINIDGDIYSCSYAEYHYESHNGNFSFVLPYEIYINDIVLIFEEGEYSEGSFYENRFNYLYPNGAFPADPVEGQIANYDDGNGNIGLYRYDGTAWQPYGGGEGGDSHILKASSGTPENLSAGDVYATYKASEAAQIGDTWVDTGSMTPSWSRYYDGNQPQAIRVEAPQGILSQDIFSFGYACNDYNTGDMVSLDGEGKLIMTTDLWTEVSANHWVLTDAAWVPSKTDGNVLYVDFDGTYVYIYSTNVEKLWMTDVNNYSTNQNVYTGEVTPPSDAECKVFQAGIKSVPNVKIELEGNARVDGTLDDPEQVVTMSDGSMKISFYDASNWVGNVCDLESFGTYFHLYFDGSNDGWTLFDSDEENALIKIIDGESGSADFGDGNVYLSYSDGVLTAYTDYDKGWKNWDMGDTHEVITAQELAKASDIPSNARLLPENPNEGDMTIYSSDEWRTTSIGAVIYDGMGIAFNYDESAGDSQVLVRHSSSEMEWLPQGLIQPIGSETMPSIAKAGAAWVYGQKGQSGEWKSYDGGSYKKMRINNSVNANLFFDYGTENISIQFSPTGMTVNGSLWLPVDGEFSGTTAGGLGITGRTSDGYFYCDTDSEVTNISNSPSFDTLEVKGEEIPASYGIKQYQGLSSTEKEWIYKDDIPADRDYSIYSYRVDVTDPNAYAAIDFDIDGCTNNITWADGALKSSDIELTDDGNGVYTGTSSCSWSVSAWTSGSYFYISCDRNMDDGISIFNGGEWYVEVPKPVTANVVTSTNIKNMVRISQADYTALAVKDPETMYIIIG